jgi:hypothetical protein
VSGDTVTLDVGSRLTKPSATAQLAALARPLKPDREPYYLRAEQRPPTLRRELPTSGWYWKPAGHPFAVFLGRNFLEARDELLELHRRELAEAS